MIAKLVYEMRDDMAFNTPRFRDQDYHLQMTRDVRADLLAEARAGCMFVNMYVDPMTLFGFPVRVNDKMEPGALALVPNEK